MSNVRTSATAVFVLVLAISLTLVAAPAAASGTSASAGAGNTSGTNVAGSTTYAVIQDGDCVATVEPFGDGTQSVEDFYDYRIADDDGNGVYSSVGTQALQESQTSQLFLYEGENGTSLVALHDELGDEQDGGLVTFNVSGLPSDAEWAVQDDGYDGATNYDNFTIDGNTSHVDWFWESNRTDGGALRGLESDEFDALFIQPGFNDHAHHDHPAAGDGYNGGEVRSWNVLSDDGSSDGAATSLNMSQNVTVVEGSCQAADAAALLETVDVWDRSILPLRTDESNAATAIPNADWRIRSPSGDEASLNKDPIAVYNESDTVTVEFDLSDANGNSEEFRGEDVHLVAGRIQTQNLDSLSLLEMRVSDINANVEFTSVGTETLDSNGDATFQFQPTQSGQYALMLANASDGDGFVVSDGNLSIDGNVTVIGVEQAAVQEGASTVDPTTLEEQSSVASGANLTFDATAGTSDGTVAHTVVVYDEMTGWVNQSFVIDVKEEISSDFNVSEDVTIEHSVNRTNGVVRVGNQRRTRPVNLPELIDAVAPDSVEPNTEYVPEEGGERLDASLTAINGTASETITVETHDNWTTDTQYRWVHVAVEDDGTTMYTDTGTFRLDDGTDSGDDGDDGSDGGDGDDGAPGGGGGGAPGGVGPPIQDTEVNVTNVDGRAIVRIRNAKAFRSVDVNLSSVFADREGVRLDEMSVEFTQDRDFDMTVAQGPESVPPVHGTDSDFEYVPSVHGTNSDFEYINVSYAEEPETDEVQFTFTVDESVLEERGLNFNDVALYRYHEGEWEQLETTIVGPTDSGYRYRAQSPGLSVFAVSSEEPQVAPQSALEVSDASIDPETIVAGDSTTVSATVENTADEEGTFTVNLTVDGEVVDQRTVTLDPGESETVTFTRQFDGVGQYQIGIGGVDAGELSVDDAAQTTTTETTEAPSDDDEEESGVGLLLPLLLVLLVIGAIIYYAWQNDDIDFPPEGFGGDGSGPDSSDTADALEESSGLGTASTTVGAGESSGQETTAADEADAASDESEDGDGVTATGEFDSGFEAASGESDQSPTTEADEGSTDAAGSDDTDDGSPDEASASEGAEGPTASSLMGDPGESDASDRTDDDELEATDILGESDEDEESSG